MTLEPSSSPSCPAKSTFLTLPREIREEIYTQLLDGHLRIRAPCPLSRRAPLKSTSVTPLLATCSQIRDEAAPIIYRKVHFGWLANMTKALSNPVRKALYSQNILEATSQYDIGLIEDCLKAVGRLSRLQRLTLLAVVSAPRTEETQTNAIFKSLSLYRDDLDTVEMLPTTLHINFQLSVIDFSAKMQDRRAFVVTVHGEGPELPTGMVGNPFDLREVILMLAE